MEEKKMTKIVLTKTLKQHTPLLHFSPTEPGATLRASEVKPKLDRYLIKKLGGGGYDSVKQQVRTNNPDWFVKKEDVYALNYQLKIIAEGRNESITIGDVKEVKKKNNETQIEEKKLAIANYPLVLSNMGSRKLGEEEKFANFSFYEYIRLVFIIPTEVNEQYEFIDDNHKEEYLKNLNGLYKVIEENIAEFFSLTNFGQRSGKGFGSFTVTDDNNNSVICFPEKPPYFTCTLKSQSKSQLFSDLFTIIDYYWKSLKTGINYPSRTIRVKDKKTGKIVLKEIEQVYHKSFLYRYLNKEEHGLTWEKRLIKKELDFINGDKKQTVENPHPAFFARAQLGLPGDFIQYLVPEKYYDRKENCFKEVNKPVKVFIKHKVRDRNEDKIERIPSPIIFKPIVSGSDVTVYLLVNDKVVAAISGLPDNTRFSFTREKTSRTVDVDLFPNKEKYIIDQRDLIASFHEKLGHVLKVVDFKRNEIAEVKLFDK